MNQRERPFRMSIKGGKKMKVSLRLSRRERSIYRKMRKLTITA